MKITLELMEDGKLGVGISENTTFSEIMQILGNGILHVMKTTAANNDAQDAKENIYDFSNELFTSILENYAPDKELRPDLDSEAILEVANNKITQLADNATTN
jgi:hypothetical protein